ncbi:ShlB/FhaC/HecB family hemolysin secretion/activation protein, partial [Enterobacter roggenkampii]
MNSSKIKNRIISLVNYAAAILLAVFFLARANAAPLSPADRDSIQQQQQQLLLQNQQQREELERSIPRPAPARPLPVTGSGPCFTIHTITLSGATLISPKT